MHLHTPKVRWNNGRDRSDYRPWPLFQWLSEWLYERVSVFQCELRRPAERNTHRYASSSRGTGNRIILVLVWHPSLLLISLIAPPTTFILPSSFLPFPSLRKAEIFAGVFFKIPDCHKRGSAHFCWDRSFFEDRKCSEFIFLKFFLTIMCCKCWDKKSTCNFISYRAAWNADAV